MHITLKYLAAMVVGTLFATTVPTQGVADEFDERGE